MKGRGTAARRAVLSPRSPAATFFAYRSYVSLDVDCLYGVWIFEGPYFPAFAFVTLPHRSNGTYVGLGLTAGRCEGSSSGIRISTLFLGLHLPFL